MFKGNKGWIYSLCTLVLLWVWGVWCVQAETFSERLEQIWLDITSFSNKKSVSRYEVARLLNAANCEDCVQAPDWMRQTYNQTFWNGFKAIDGKDFNDINYWGALWNRTSYYYCVAYIWDNGYMAWYPSTSTKCQWNFCGQDAITVSEAYQTVLNIIQNQIKDKYQINWSAVKSWMNRLDKSKRNIILNQTNIDAINKADTKSTYAQNNDEFQAWLKYCMYNLSWCNFQTFGKIWQAYWPVSELNILYKEWIISQEDALKVAESNNSLNWEDALRLFGSLFNNYASCSFNVDYDCDGVTNGKDNCPYVYNLNQYDEDGDGVWNVCDEDIDGDGEKNPIWIVDDNNHVVVSLWDSKLDQTPLWNWDLWFGFFIDVDSIANGLPALVVFNPLADADIESIEWDFGDGTVQNVSNGNKVRHIFKSSWNFIVKAIATSKKGWKSFAMTKIFIADAAWKDYALNISPSFTFKNWLVEYTFTPLYSWDMNQISWGVNDSEEKTLKVWEKYKFTVAENGVYVVNAKWYKDGELKAVAMLTLNHNWTPSYANMTIKPAYLWEDVSVTTNLAWVLRKDIENIGINWWWETTDSQNLTQKYAYSAGWLQTIQQIVELKDGTKLYAVATMTIQNPDLLQSYALNVEWKRLNYNQNEKMALWLNMYPKSSAISLFTSYQAGKKDFIVNPNFDKQVLDFSYVTAGDKVLTNSVEVNKCVSLMNQWTVHINSVDVCMAAIKSNKLSNYKCDKDGDKIPDICDDDIDGDGKKNLIWLITHENKDCSITANNINIEVLKRQFWICSLDNCPFDWNEDQLDMNNNWVWEMCESRMSDLLKYSMDIVDGWNGVMTLDMDGDQDWIPDTKDSCPSVPWNSANGCPQYANQNCWVFSSCGNGKIDAWETCLNCPQDVGECCGNGKLESRESCKSCPADAWVCELCGNGKIDDWENCKSCPQDVGECTATCGDGIIQDAETCQNCAQDVGECTATCGDGRVQVAEDCDSCSKDVKQCKSDLCGNGKLDRNEECDNWANNWKDNKCTVMCTKYNPSKPNCGNGKIDDWENCITCSVDLWGKCVKDWDFGDLCGNGIVDNWETCLSCSQDVWECTASCWNGKVEVAEDCDNCSKDVKFCKSDLCGNGKVDKNEECDNWWDNGKDNKCTKMCTKYDPSKPNCGNGMVDLWENCGVCSVDLWYRCVDGWDSCWNGKIDAWEDCKSCPQDVWECTAFCGDGIIQEAEDCRNCEKDVWKCSATCGDGKIQIAEDCKNCNEDVKLCRSSTCGDGKVDERAWEECDNWWDNGKDKKCTKMCTKYDPTKPNCGNGKLDEWENCNTCAVDLWEKCVAQWDKEEKCWNGKIDAWEDCDPNDISKKNRWKFGCSDSCKKISSNVAVCNSNYDWQVFVKLSDRYNLCSRWSLVKFNYDASSLKWMWLCGTSNESVECTAQKTVCGDGVSWNWEDCKNCSKDVKDPCIDQWDPLCGNGKIDDWEDCKNCPQDVKDRCVDKKEKECWNWLVDDWEDCKNCPQDLKDRCIDDPVCGNGVVDKWEDCKNCPQDVKDPCVDDEEKKCGNGKIDKWEDCKNCPQDVKDPCVDPNTGTETIGTREELCGNGQQDSWETCDTCPEDLWWCAKTSNECNSCPCEYVDFAAHLTRWDTIRAKLWDKPHMVFYNYSNTLAVENFLDIK